MKTFIREAWELWYWSMFSPLKLNQRIQEWVPPSAVIRERRLPQTDDEIRETRFSDIMLWAVQPGPKATRIRQQYMLMLLLSTLPLAAACLALGGFRDLSLWLAITSLCLGWGATVPAMGLVMPWISAWIYIRSPGLAALGVVKIADRLPPVGRMAMGLAVVAIVCALTVWLVAALRERYPKLAGAALGVGAAGGFAAGARVVLPGESLFSNTVGGLALAGAWLCSLEDAKNEESEGLRYKEQPVRHIPPGLMGALVVGVGLTLVLGPGDEISGVVVITSMALTALSLIVVLWVLVRATSQWCIESVGCNMTRCLLLGLAGAFAFPILLRFFWAWGELSSWATVGLAFIVGFGVAPSRTGVRPLRFTKKLLNDLIEEHWSGILSLPEMVLRYEPAAWMQVFVIAMFTAIGLSFGQGYVTLACFSAFMLGYIRILPDWLLLALTAQWRLSRINPATSAEVLAWLHDMPPYAYDIALLQIPGHARLWALLFNKNPSVALGAISHAERLAYSSAYVRTEWQAWQRIGVFVAKLPASERSALVRQALIVPQGTAAVASFSSAVFPIGMLLKESYINPECHGQWLSNGDIEQFVPLFKDVAAKVEAARAAGHPVEQERGLEGAVADLSAMRTRIRDLGVDVDPWLDVVDHWERLLGASIEALGVPQGELLQPFQAGGALRPDRSHLFKGRRQLTEHVAREVAGVGYSPLILHGPRQCGKSSFLLHLSRLLSPGILPVYVDLQSQAITSSESEFCFRLITAAIRDLRGVCPRVQQLPKVERAAFQPNPYPVFEDWLDLLLSNIDDNRLLICIDEFEKLGKAMERGHMSTAIFDELRHLSQHRDRLRFIFCGAQTFEELGPQWTHYFITSKPIEVRYLKPDEARQLLEDPDPKFGLKYAPGVLDRIIGLTACQPYLVQLVGEAMVKVARMHGTRVIDRGLLDTAIKEALPAGEFYFASLWAETTGRNEEEVRSGQQLLSALAADRDLPPLEGPARAALQRLQRYHVVAKHDDGYRIEIPLVAQWVRERKVGDVFGETNSSHA